MVLSNKKLKQKLRAAKTELLVASEAQTSGAQDSIQSLLKTVAQKPRLSKREKRRENVKSLPEKSNTSGGSEERREEGEGEAEGVAVERKKEKKKKRKRGDATGEENREGEEVKKANELKKKKKKKKKGKKKKTKKVENGEVNEGVKNGSGGNAEHFVVETNHTSESKENLEPCTKVYVGGIPYYSTEDDIRSFFESCGTITEIDCMKFPESGKFRGIAIITFKTEAASKRALALDGSDMGGLYLKIQPYKSARVNKAVPFTPAIVEGYNRIYAGNLSWDITEDDLKKLFSDCSVTSIRFGEDKETGEFKGYAHVDFSDSISVNVALKLDQTVVCGRPVRISCAVPKKAAITNLKPFQQNSSEPLHQDTSTNQVNSNEVAPVSSKIRRRTCYQCGERGHLSSSCPNKPAADQANPVAS